MKKVFIAAAVCLAWVVGCYADEMAMMKAMVQSVNLSDIRAYGKDALVKKNPLKTDKFVFNTYFLAPRQVLGLHKHETSDELFYVVEGNGQLTVGNDQIMASAGTAVYGPANVPHGIVNSGNDNMMVISVQAPTPVKIEALNNSSMICSVCGQEDIIPAGAKEGDTYECPRCHAKFKLYKTAEGKWAGTKI